MPPARTRSLTALAGMQVDRQVQKRGVPYFHTGAVQILESDDHTVEAAVQGTDEYTVLLQFDEHDLVLNASCTCPYFSDRSAICKHIWATLLTCEKDGLLRSASAAAGFDLMADHDELDGEEADDIWDDQWDEDRSDYREASVYVPLPPTARPGRGQRRQLDPKAIWKQQMASLSAAMQPPSLSNGDRWPADRQILYLVDVDATLDGQGLIVEVAYRQRKKNDQWSKPKSLSVDLDGVEALPDAADRQIISMLIGASNGFSSSYSSYYRSGGCRYTLPGPMQETMLQWMCRTRRCMLRCGKDDPKLHPIQWDDGPPWQLWLEVGHEESGYQITGSLRRDERRMALSEPVLLVAGGIVFTDSHAARLDDGGAFAWISLLRQQPTLMAPVSKGSELLETLLSLPRYPRLDLPDSLRFEQVQGIPKPRLMVRSPKRWGRNDRLIGELSFEYDRQVIDVNHPTPHVFQAGERRLVKRDLDAEQAADAMLRQLGFRDLPHYRRQKDNELSLAPRHLSGVVSKLLEAGWLVEADGKVYRSAGSFDIEVRSGIDWFELHGQIKFGDTPAKLPELLKALQRGENTVQLDDGSFGVLPEQWLAKYGVLVGLGATKEDHVRFAPMQAGLLDALLAAMPEARWDEQFAKTRDQLHTFEGIKPTDPPDGFIGILRGYQRDGLGWLHFLRQFGFGGCLADDMGLGKTVQVLALLESRRRLRSRRGNGKSERPRPSLVVVPLSLVFNWQQEVTRFTPQLRVLNHTGTDRPRTPAHFDDYDLIVTTYGTLRRDAAMLENARFDYVILDEAQAIKNAKTASAKAARLLQGEHRLVLTGTPIENHLGDLWSLFEFLNPGMLGAASVFKLAGNGSGDDPTRQLLAKALRPFLLRRTKEQVAKDLPDKLEQTLCCELPPKQQKLYNELRDHYRLSLLKQVDRNGLNKSKIQILEALLRLRQAACHPGLIDKSKAAQPSAKLDLLLPQLAEVLDEGHKALVFSQFTSMLAIVRDRLDAQDITYEYLDGRTRKRSTRIERFQTDPDCKLFLISLKAGGLGLNLTAADYVFLLDPWWNPAVETQAIDRAHRIGQTKQVFAYRLIARDTVEEKVLELQQSKRNLADVIITADNSLIRKLGREDLELLLS